MTLQEIVAKFKKKSWLRVCTLNNIDKWSLIDYLGESVYAGRFHIKSGLEITTRVCLVCGASLSLGIYRGNFLARIVCGCNKKGSLRATDKLNCIFTKEQILSATSASNHRRKKGLANTVDFWVHRGFSINQAKAKIAATQKSRSARSPAAKKGARGYSVRTVEYWLKKGLTHEAAKSKVREVQVTNGLKYYIKKYGQRGEELFNSRIARWLNAPGNKQMTANRSKKSFELFTQLGIGHYGQDEKIVFGKRKNHRVDFLYEKKIIEYYGDYWHGNPKFYTHDQFIRKKKVADVWEHDAQKIKDLEDNGYSVLIVWENDYASDSDAVIKKCKDFVKC